MLYLLNKQEATMKFSMSCMKNIAIPLKEETITFKPKTEELLRRARELYISGVKQGNEDDFNEFFEISVAITHKYVVCKDFLMLRRFLKRTLTIPPGTLNWGIEYLMQFFTDEYLRDFFESKGFMTVLPDKHIVKMPLECCQMLSIVKI